MHFQPRYPNPAGEAKSNGFPLQRFLPCGRCSIHGVQSRMSRLAVANPLASKHRLKFPLPEKTSTAS